MKVKYTVTPRCNYHFVVVLKFIFFFINHITCKYYEFSWAQSKFYLKIVNAICAIVKSFICSFSNFLTYKFFPTGTHHRPPGTHHNLIRDSPTPHKELIKAHRELQRNSPQAPKALTRTSTVTHQDLIKDTSGTHQELRNRVMIQNGNGPLIKFISQYRLFVIYSHRISNLVRKN